MEPRTLFFEVAGIVASALRPGELFTSYYAGEDSDFARFNHNRVRQAGHVTQRFVSIDLIEGARHAVGTVPLSGDLTRDRIGVERLLEELRSQRAHLGEDPHLHYAETVQDTEDVRPSALPDPREAIDIITRTADDLDMVGIWASGTLDRGFANAFGQRNWFETSTFNFDFSCHHLGDKAVKGGYAGFNWDEDALGDRLDRAREELEMMTRPPRTVPRGAYRAYLAPRAGAELMQVLGWEGFGLKGHRTGNTSLVKMVKGDERFDPSITITENHGGGMAPPFTMEGFIKPEKVVLIEEGACRGALAGSRSAKEFGEPVNADSELPTSLFMAPGHLPESEVLERLGTGVYISDAWYCNYSDRNDCRMTGMTRFASFWVEEGKIKAPLNVMRFDDSLYRMLGEGLLGLTTKPELLVDPRTYRERSTRVTALPGLLVEDFQLTL